MPLHNLHKELYNQILQKMKKKNINEIIYRESWSGILFKRPISINIFLIRQYKSERTVGNKFHSKHKSYFPWCFLSEMLHNSSSIFWTKLENKYFVQIWIFFHDAINYENIARWICCFFVPRYRKKILSVIFMFTN